MHKMIAEASLATIRAKIAEGDCPTIKPYSVEVLEELVVHFADLAVHLAASPAPQEQGVKVRRLKWRDAPIPPSWECLASSSVGLYCIPLGGPTFRLTLRDKDALGAFQSIEAAKAAAQSDYETRILSALTIQEPASEPVDARSKGYVLNCHLQPKTGDAQMFYGDETGRLSPTLDGYAIIPLDEYSKLKAIPPAATTDLVARLIGAANFWDIQPDGGDIPTLSREAAARITSLIAERDEIISLGQRVSTAERDRITRAEAALAMALEERDKLRADLAFADRQSASVEALLEPHVKWEPGTIRVCPLRDAACPHGLACPYTDGYDCKPGWNSALQSQRPE